MMRYLERVAEVTPPFRVAVEVRNRSWMEPGNRVVPGFAERGEYGVRRGGRT